MISALASAVLEQHSSCNSLILMQEGITVRHPPRSCANVLVYLTSPIVEQFDFAQYIELYRNGVKFTHTKRYYNANEIRSSELFRVPPAFQEVF